MAALLPGQQRVRVVAWEYLLFTQFHDILAGTSIAAAWPSVRAYQGRARAPMIRVRVVCYT